MERRDASCGEFDSIPNHLSHRRVHTAEFLLRLNLYSRMQSTSDPQWMRMYLGRICTVRGSTRTNSAYKGAQLLPTYNWLQSLSTLLYSIVCWCTSTVLPGESATIPYTSRIAKLDMWLILALHSWLYWLAWMTQACSNAPASADISRCLLVTLLNAADLLSQRLMPASPTSSHNVGYHRLKQCAATTSVIG